MKKKVIKDFNQAYKIGCEIFDKFGNETNIHHCAGVLTAINVFMNEYLSKHEIKIVKSFIERRDNE